MAASADEDGGDRQKSSKKVEAWVLHSQSINKRMS